MGLSIASHGVYERYHAVQYACGSWRHIGLQSAWNMRDGFLNEDMLSLKNN
ncbi:hypothetical protein [Undibacterium sp. Ren11W]|uniref:hypothetical protein n=1 Tax=Undibacterium sp. Ren11W TaxID=3413045 RepID=UPI003BF5EDEA